MKNRETIAIDKIILHSAKISEATHNAHIHGRVNFLWKNSPAIIKLIKSVSNV